MSKSKHIFTEEQEQEIIEFYLQPNSLNDTARKFDVHTRIIDRILAKNNIHKHSKEVTKQIEINKRCKIKDEKIEKEIVDFYLLPQSLLETARHFDLSTRAVQRILRQYNIEEHSGEVAKQVFIQNRHARKFTSDEEEKAILDYYLEPNSMKATMEKFNCGNSIIKRILEKYNVKEHSEEIYRKIQAEKSEKTNLEKYGVKSILEINRIKEDGMLEKYGNINPALVQGLREKTIKTNLERYGVENPMQAKEIQDKAKQTNLEKYGVENGGGSRQAQEKIKKTNLERYGVENSFQADIVKEKIKQTLFDRYGVYHALASRYKYQEQYFDSFPELCFYMYYIENNIGIIREPVELNFIFEGKLVHYYPDFLVNNQLIEIKGDQFLTEDGSWCNPFDHSLDALFKTKYECAIKNNVKILYSKDYQRYIDWFEQQGYKKEIFKIN